MLKDLLARFKKVLTVAEWKKEAQGAIEAKEFVIASLAELHRVEKADAANAQERAMQRQPMQPMQQGRGPMPTGQTRPMSPMPMASASMQSQQPYATQQRAVDRSERDRKKNELSLADLMNQIKQQQQIS